MKVRPLHDRIIVQRFDEGEQKVGGIIILDSAKEKRRLSPIPYDWTTCNEDTLELYARRGEPVGGPHRTFGFSDEEPIREAG